MKRLSSAERMRLSSFVCSFAWTDLAVSAKEKALVTKLVGALSLSDADRKQVAAWLKVPPAEDALDPIADEAATDRLPRRRFATTPSGLGRSIGWGPPASRIVASRDDSPAYGPTEVPLAHRRLFLDAARAVIRVDGVKPAELDALSLFEDLVR